MLKRSIALLALAALPLISVAQSAASFPTRQVRLIVGFAPGGPTDIFARMFAQHLEKKYKQPGLAENRPGAGALIAGEFVAKAPPDGYTLFVGANTFAYESVLNRESPINTARDLLPFGIFAGTSLFVTTHASLPVKNMAEFIAWIKANPGKLNIGTAGTPVAKLEGLRDKLGLEWVNVPYKGGALAMTALLAGEVLMYTADANQALPAAKEGRVRTLAYMDRQRHALAPDVPTVAESGIGAPDFVSHVWLGMYAPAAVPADIVAKLNAEVNEMNATQEAGQRYVAMGWKAGSQTLEQIRRDSAAEVANVQALLAKGVKLR
jgi:tripartite-type tricarboxylate transporter receptor subunit TctC